MKNNKYRFDRGKAFRVSSVFIGIAVNVVVAYVLDLIGLPFYTDNAGTIGATIIGGIVPGVITAIATNVICGVFNGNALYFSIVNIIIAIFTALYIRKKPKPTVKNVAFFVVLAGSISGVFSSLIQLKMVDQPQSQMMLSLMETAKTTLGVSKTLAFLGANTTMNMVLKGISLGLSGLILHFIPSDIRREIRNSGWRQRPLSFEEVSKLDSMNRSSTFPLNRRMALILFSISMALMLIMGTIGIQLYFRNYKHEKIEIATAAAKFAADVVASDKIDEYIARGNEVEDYHETEEMLYKIRANAPGVDRLYIMAVRNDGLYYAFDLDTDDTLGHEAGYFTKWDESTKPYQTAMLEGLEIDPIEGDTASGWLVTVYYPIKNSSGFCQGYVGADVSLSYTADYMKDFLLCVFLIMSGFLVVILIYAIWVTDIYVVYPINTIVGRVEEFIAAGSEQEKLDESVKALRAIDVRTGDEVEKLYHAVCNMGSNQTEQLRSLLRVSENTSKMQDGLIVTMADLVESRDSDTGAHVQKTSAYVRIIVEGLKRKGYYAEKITPKFISDVVRSAPLHDVGKINIPDTVLNKPGKLIDEEYAIIKTHTTAGKKIMEKAISTVEGENYLKEARNMAAYHHERWDGKGYPEGLHGEVIPLAARIMAVADVFDALASPRVYKPAFPLEKAISIIQEGAGTQFDPKCVEVFMEALPEVKAVLQKYQGDVEVSQ